MALVAIVKRGYLGISNGCFQNSPSTMQFGVPPLISHDARVPPVSRSRLLTS
jgi:hypothetical protein